MADSPDLVVIGAGPAGYVAAIRAAQMGRKVTVVEREPALGGTCLRIGCIPSKALLESSARYHQAKHGLEEHGTIVENVRLDLGRMMERRAGVVKSLTDGIAYLFKKNGITHLQGTGSLTADGAVLVNGDTRLEPRDILIATGSEVSPLPGVEPDGGLIGTSTEALEWDTVPEHLVVIGAGFIGLELGSVWQRLGARVTVVEYMDRILPGMDADTAREALKAFRQQGIEFRLGQAVTGAVSDGDRVTLSIRDQDDVIADRVLLAVGRRPHTSGLGLQEAGVKLDERGRIEVDGSFRTSVPNVYAVGDVIKGPMLAHKAEEEGVAAVEAMAGIRPRLDHSLIPGIVYTDPEVATVGASEEQLKEQGVEYRKGTFPFAANGRAKSSGSTFGRVKVLAHAETDRVLGVHIIGPHAGDLIAEAVTAMTFGASAEDIALTIHAHPTLSEAVKEAALAVHGRALHI